MRKFLIFVALFVYASLVYAQSSDRLCPKLSEAPSHCPAVDISRCYVDSSSVIRICNGAGAWQSLFPAEQITGNVTMSSAGATTIAATAVTASMLANGAGLAALITAGGGASATYTKATNGTQTLLAADAVNARVVLLVAVVTEVFANGTGGQTVYVLGETTTTAKYNDGTAFTDAALGKVFVFSGTLTATKALLVTATAATGTGTGAIAITALVLPATP